ncbi:MAG: helix-turn-helix domain-containing protein [bacterium]|nr:helix-turn-helix domain-containing protein [bacterium]
MLTIDEAAERLNVSVRFVRRLVAERRVPYLKIGKFVRFDQDDLDSGNAAQRVGQSHPFVVRISGVS